MALPLPGREIILEIHEYLLDLPTDDFYVDQATNLIRKWITRIMWNRAKKAITVTCLNVIMVAIILVLALFFIRGY